jgi:hypothetical protein
MNLYVTLFWQMSKKRKISRDKKTFYMILLYTTREKKRNEMIISRKRKKKQTGLMYLLTLLFFIFDIQIIVDRIHLLLYWQLQPMVLTIQRKTQLNTQFLSSKLPVNVTLPVVKTLRTALLFNLTVAPGWISGS